MAGGRRPFAQIDISSYSERLKPPAYLSEDARRAFIDLTSRCPAAQFIEADIPLMCRWCELEALAQQAMAELYEHSPVTADGKVSPWFTIHQQATKGQSLLALRLRLGPQSRANRAPKSLPAKMSYYERMSLEDSDEDEAQPS